MKNLDQLPFLDNYFGSRCSIGASQKFLLPAAEVHPEPNQISKMEFLVEIVNNYMSLATFGKISILDILLSSDNVSALSQMKPMLKVTFLEIFSMTSNNHRNRSLKILRI